MTKITVDGKEYEIPRLKFKQLKIIWPRLRDSFTKMQTARQATGKTVDGVTALFEATEDAFFVIATAMSREPPPGMEIVTPEWLEENMEPLEVQQLPRVINDIMLETGLMKMGKPDPAAVKALEESLSTGTGTQSSPSSSQRESREEAGAA